MAEGMGKEHERETFGERVGSYVLGAVLYIGEFASYLLPPTEEEINDYRRRLMEDEI